MQTNYTPGPWEVKEIRWDNGKLISRNVCRGQLPIASISNNHWANANLIASTPDLVNICKNHLIPCLRAALSYMDVEEWRNAIKKAEAILNKAESK